LVTVGVGEEWVELGFQHVGLDREVQSAAFPLGRKALGWSAAPEELFGGRQAALFADHWSEARRVVAELTLCRLVDRDHCAAAEAGVGHTGSVGAARHTKRAWCLRRKHPGHAPDRRPGGRSSPSRADDRNVEAGSAYGAALPIKSY
jgi:hypothetical protein